MKRIGIEEIKNIQINILKSFASFCEANNMHYYLAYGTLLGAVRHKGYIPWDDDVDVIMPRPDYKRFIEEFKDDRYIIFCPEKDEDCPFSYAKLYDSRTILDEHTSRKYHIGLNIDIFVLDGLPVDAKNLKKFMRECSFYINILNIKKIAFSEKRSWLKNMMLFALKFFTLPFPYNRVRNKMIKLNQKYRYCSSKHCSDLCYTGALCIPKSVFGEGHKALFEDRMYNIPTNYDLWLKMVYGNYMQLPPEEKRISHHDYQAFWKNTL